MVTINRYLLCLSLFINYILYYLKKISFSKKNFNRGFKYKI